MTRTSLFFTSINVLWCSNNHFCTYAIIDFSVNRSVFFNTVTFILRSVGTNHKKYTTEDIHCFKEYMFSENSKKERKEKKEKCLCVCQTNAPKCV